MKIIFLCTICTSLQVSEFDISFSTPNLKSSQPLRQIMAVWNQDTFHWPFMKMPLFVGKDPNRKNTSFVELQSTSLSRNHSAKGEHTSFPLCPPPTLSVVSGPPHYLATLRKSLRSSGCFPSCENHVCLCCCLPRWQVRMSKWVESTYTLHTIPVCPCKWWGCCSLFTKSPWNNNIQDDPCTLI